MSDDRQFVVAAVQSRTGKAADAEGEPRYDAFELVADGEVFPAVEVEDRTVGAYTTSLAGCGQIRYDAPSVGAHTVGWITFEPTSPLAVSGTAIRCQHDAETAEWSLSDEQISKLARPAAEFELRSFEATVGEASVDVSFVAENVSEVEGRFLAAVYWPTAGIADDDESTIVDRSVAAGDRIEWTKTFDTEYAAGADGTVTASVEGVISGETKVDLGA
ncbi:hypothetical protein [Haladaptatus halobius]|uniref:hypothetical protein n=1 Tax=Haladaptatus halobius TaxID=2884875 RepID=UPI001D0B22C5|nr:hypothetical protein [Haladaptatus halobius]